MSTKDDFWWDLPEGEAHEVLFDHVRAVEERQYDIHRANLFNARLYTNRNLACLTWGGHSAEEGSNKPISLRDENIIKNVVDTATALIGRQRPKATPTPVDADWSLERHCRNADKWLYAEFKHQKVWSKMQWSFNDCLWAAVSGLYIGTDGDEIYTERVMPDELVIDQLECKSGNDPLQVTRRRVMSKVVLGSMYPEHAEAIHKAGSVEYTSYRKPESESLVVLETWVKRLGGKPGRHVIVIESATLLDEPYDRDVFPFVFLRWNKLPTGFYGRPLVEESAPYQIRHTELNRTISSAQDIMCHPRVFVEEGSEIVDSHLDGDEVKVIKFRGQTPIVMTWQAVGPELYAERDRNETSMFESAGISRMSAQAKVPDGVRFDSSKALREANHTQNERFQVQSAMLEDAYMQVAEHYMYHGKKLYAGKKPGEWRNRTLLDKMDWDIIGDPGHKYSMLLEASSVNNMTPAAKEDQLDRWSQRGLLTPDEYKGLLQSPDMPEQESLFTSSMDHAKHVLEQLDEGEFPQPDPLTNLTFTIRLVQQTYNARLTQKNVPDYVKNDMRDWLTEARAMMQDAAQAQMVAQSEATLATQGAPTPAVATTAQGSIVGPQ